MGEDVADPRNWHFAFRMKRDLPERLIFGRECGDVSTFFADRAFDHGAHAVEDVDVFARALARPGNTRGSLEGYRAVPTDRPADALAWKTHPWTIQILALGGEHRYGPLIVDMLEGCAVDVSDGSITGRVHWLPEARPPETAEAVLSVLAGSRPAVHASNWEPA